MADQLKPTMLSALKRTESLNFYLVFSSASPRHKNSFFCHMISYSLYLLVFFLVFSSSLGGFSPMHGSFSSSSAYSLGLGSKENISVFLISYQLVRRFFINRFFLFSSSFFLSSLGGFSSIDFLVFLYHFPSSFEDFFSQF